MTQPSPDLIFRRRLAAIRAVRGLTLRELDTLSGVSHNTISQVERGRNISLTNAARLSQALGWPLVEFLSDAPGGPLDELRAGTHG